MRRLRTHFETNFIPDTRKVSQSDSQAVNSFSELVKEVAWLSNTFPHQLLFFRGQRADHKNKAGATTIYPSIYRNEPLRKEEIYAKYEVLDTAANDLADRLSQQTAMKHSRDDLKRRKYVQWSILQHYDICPTPLIDITQSLRVACSFALNNNNNNLGYIYVIGLPYLTNRISMNSEEDIVNVRLLSICPPTALRPHFQEGYVVGTLDTTTEYDAKSDLDFNRRLVRKFSVPTNDSFWKPDGGPIPDRLLFPKNDLVADLCQEIKTVSDRMARPGEIGYFVRGWSLLATSLRDRIDMPRDQVESVVQTVKRGKQLGQISTETAVKLHNLRRIRNMVVHGSHEVDAKQIRNALDLLNEVMLDLDIEWASLQ